MTTRWREFLRKEKNPELTDKVWGITDLLAGYRQHDSWTRKMLLDECHQLLDELREVEEGDITNA